MPGIQPREVQIFENGVLQNIRYWTVDPFPLSVALVVLMFIHIWVALKYR